MTDIVDMASEIEGEHLARAISAARVPVPAGVPGECDECGEDVGRLVGGRCAPCRDGRRKTRAIVRVAPIAISEESDVAKEPVRAVREGNKVVRKPVEQAEQELTPRQRMALLLGGMEALIVELIEQAAGADKAATAELQEQLGAAIARADAAEARLAQMRAVLA